jgi:glycerol transport system ATP-binding protein
MRRQRGSSALELTLEGVCCDQGGEAWLKDVSLRLQNGMTVLIGPATAGKTTLMRVIAGLLPPTAGRILIDGKDVSSISVRKRSVAFVYQQFINYPSLSVYDNIASPLRLAADFPKSHVDRRVHEVAALMGIEGLLGRRPAELSGGQQQRTAIARALARPVDVLLLDEPLANLDYKLREQLRSDLKSMFRDSGRIVIYSTAEPAEALTFAATTVVMGEGRVQHVGDVAEMYDHPPTLAVASTLSDPPLNLLPGSAEAGRISCLGASFPAPGADVPGQEVILGVRPHHVRIERAGPEDLQFTAEIRLAEVTGSATFLHLLLPGERHLVAELPGPAVFTPGEPAVAFVDPADVFVFDAVTGRLLATSAVEVDLHG